MVSDNFHSLILRILHFVISSGARNLSGKTKISPSPPITLFELGSFEMTRVGLSWPSRLFSHVLTNASKLTSFLQKLRTRG